MSILHEIEGKQNLLHISVNTDSFKEILLFLYSEISRLGKDVGFITKQFNENSSNEKIVKLGQQLDNLSEETHKKMENFSVTLNSLSKNFSDQQEHIRETKNEFKTSLDEYMSKIDDALGRLPIEEIKKFFGEPNDEISETENAEIRSIKDYENEINALKKRVGKLEKHFGKGKKLSGKSSAKNSIVSGKKDKVSKKEPTSAIPQLSDFKYTEVSEQFQKKRGHVKSMSVASKSLNVGKNSSLSSARDLPTMTKSKGEFNTQNEGPSKKLEHQYGEEARSNPISNLHESSIKENNNKIQNQAVNEKPNPSETSHSDEIVKTDEKGNIIKRYRHSSSNTDICTPLDIPKLDQDNLGKDEDSYEIISPKDNFIHIKPNESQVSSLFNESQMSSQLSSEGPMFNLGSSEIENDLSSLKGMIEQQSQQIFALSHPGASIEEVVEKVIKNHNKKIYQENQFRMRQLYNEVKKNIEDIKHELAETNKRINQYATHDDVSALLSEIPNSPQNLTSIGQKPCYCLACGRPKTAVSNYSMFLDPNTQTILNYPPLNETPPRPSSTRIKNFTSDSKHAIRKTTPAITKPESPQL